MTEPRRILLTHFDLDGIGCDIILSKLFQFEKKYKSGYPKMKKFIEEGNYSGYDSIVISDLSLTEEQFTDITAEYKEKFVYIDHHKPSVDMVKSLPNTPSLCFVDTKFSASGIAFQLFNDRLPSEMTPFVLGVDAYDCWRHKTHPQQFQDGYNLNALFWTLGYNDFYSRFSKDFSLNWSKDEHDIIVNNLDKRDEAIEKSDKTPFGRNSLVVLDAPKEYVNDYGLLLPDIDIFYLMYTTVSGDLSLSVRTVLDDVDVGAALQTAKIGNPHIKTAGGHPQAGGMDFYDGIDFEFILEVIETINDILEGNEPVVPF